MTAAARLDGIASTFLERFPAQTPSWRTVGREAEFPVVQADGSAADIAAMWAALREAAADRGVGLRPSREGALVVGLDGSPYSFVAEVGRGTIEVLTGPRSDLMEVASDHEAAMDLLLEVASAHRFSVLGYGIQPSTPASALLMTPKARYGVLHAVLGDPWLWFTLTASDQVHASIGRDEVVGLTNLANLLAPVVIALCGNSPVYGGQDRGLCSSREGGMGVIDAHRHRHGMPGGPIRSVRERVGDLAAMRFLMERVRGPADAVALEPTGGSFVDWLDAGNGDGRDGREAAFDAFLFHEHYVWHSARPRSAHATIELRAACQQPYREPGAPGAHHHMAAAALGVGIVAAGDRLSDWLHATLGAEPWPAMRAWHQDVVRHGLAADPPAPDLLPGVLHHCEEALRARGRGEETLLAPLWHRLARRENPAQRARAAFASGGLDALLAATRISA